MTIVRIHIGMLGVRETYVGLVHYELEFVV
jgi:hypothetical protein